MVFHKSNADLVVFLLIPILKTAVLINIFVEIMIHLFQDSLKYIHFRRTALI